MKIEFLLNERNKFLSTIDFNYKYDSPFNSTSKIHSAEYNKKTIIITKFSIITIKFE